MMKDVQQTSFSDYHALLTDLDFCVRDPRFFFILDAAQIWGNLKSCQMS